MKIFKAYFLAVKNLFIKHQPFILFSLIVLFVPILLSYVPYINLVYTIDKGVLIYLLIMTIFIRPPAKLLFALGIILLFLTLTLILLGFVALAEQVGNRIFFLLVVGVFLVIAEHFKKPDND